MSNRLRPARELQIEILEKQLERTRRNQQQLEARISRIENSIIFRILRMIGTQTHTLRARAGQILLNSPLHPLYIAISGAENQPDPYTSWIAEVEAAWPDFNRHRTESQNWQYQPVFSIVIPVFRPNINWLAAAIDSVRRQSYSWWEICLCLDGPDQQTESWLQSLQDSRIRTTILPRQSGISTALNAAGALASGEYVAFLDQDDLLHPFALHCIAERLQHTRAEAFYTDEDSLNSKGERVRPNFKPDWSPELLSSCMYMAHLLVVSRQRLESTGWFRSEFDGAQDYDLALRLADAGVAFEHIPRVLYHWRVHPGSTASGSEAKPWAHEAGRRALSAALGRRDTAAPAISDGPIPHSYVVRRLVTIKQLSVVIVSRNPVLLRRCLRSLFRTMDGLQYELVVVHHKQPGNTAAMEQVLREFGCSVEPWAGAFNFSAMNNAGVRRSRHPNLLFLNDDVVATSAGWAEPLLAQIARPEVGIAGPLLLYRGGTIQHAGIVIGAGEGSIHPGRGEFASDIWRWLRITRDVSAVTGACMAIRREVFDQLSGFDTRFPVNYNDVDLCLRARSAGYGVILEASSILRHDECRTRTPGTRMSERDLFEDLHGGWLDNPDPFYSIWLDPSSETIRLNNP